jgi:hypothetical protein
MAESGGDCDQTCVADDVIVDGKQAVWIFSEFETKKSLDKLVTWLTPDDWPSWGSSMFKEMKQVSTRPTTLRYPQADPHRHSKRARLGRAVRTEEPEHLAGSKPRA